MGPDSAPTDPTRVVRCRMGDVGTTRRTVTSMMYERITVDPNRMGGLPCLGDTRVTVSAVLGHLAPGRDVDEVLADHPYLERKDILAALEFAAAAVQERELPLARSG